VDQKARCARRRSTGCSRPQPSWSRPRRRTRPCESGALVRALKGTYLLADRAAEPVVRAAAALEHARRAQRGEWRRRAALSHTTALAAWAVLEPWPAVVHVSVSHGTRLLGDGVAFHQRRRFSAADVVACNGLATVPPARALVESWPLLGPQDGRAAVFRALSRRLVTPLALTAVTRELSRQRRARALKEFLALLVAGCRSELELWGYVEVLSDPQLPRPQLQYEVPTRAGAFVLDAAYRAELVGVELDGAAYHFSREQRERDMRRDAALAELGWLVVRFSHDRLRRDPGGVRRQLRQLLDVRRRQLHP
jgi:very-short-patch-repair endonuclease